MAARAFSFGGFVLRWIAAVVLVFGTFNPTGRSYYHWVMDQGDGSLPIQALVGVLLLIGFVIFLRATFRSIGGIGLVLVVALIAALVWVMVDFGFIDLNDSSVMAYVVLAAIATVMGVGMSWSHVRRRLSGQYDMDDVDQ